MISQSDYEIRISDRIVWNCEEFRNNIDNHSMGIVDTQCSPEGDSVNDYLVKLCGWKFDVRSTIFPYAKSSMVLDGWNKLSELIPLDRLCHSWYLRTFNDYKVNLRSNICREEPEFLDLLRLSYWYHKCLTMDTCNTFRCKQGEIVDKLANRLVSNVQKYKITIEGNFSDNKEKLIQQILSRISGLKPTKQKDNKLRSFLIEIVKAIWPISSELLVSGLVKESGFGVTFDCDHSNDHDYDLIVNGTPSQVKTLLHEKELVTNSDGSYSYDFKDRIDNDLTLELVNEQITQLVKNPNTIEKIEKAIDQGSKITFLNATRTLAGEILSKFSNENQIPFPFGTAVDDAFKIIQEYDNYLPLVFLVTSNAYNYEFFAKTIAIPVRKTNGNIQLDRAAL